MKKIRRGVIIMLAVVLVAGAALAAKKVYNFTGGVKTRADKGLTKEQIMAVPTNSGFYTWTYTFLLYLDDNSSSMIQLTQWQLYLVSQRGLYFSFIDKGDTPYLRKGLYDADVTKLTVDPPSLVMGPHYWKGFYPDFYVHLDFPAEDGEVEMKADIHFKCRTPGWRPGEGPTHYGAPDGDWYDLVVMIPWADVDGTITIDGKQRKIKGFGYSDHNTQNVIPTTQTDELMALRSFTDEYSINFLDYIAPEDFGRERTTWLLIMKDHKIIYATDKWEREMFDLAAEKRRGYKYPTRVTVKIDQPDCKLTGEIKGVKFIQSLDAMDEIPSFLRPIVEKFVTAPVFIRQNAVVKWHLVMPGLSIDDEFTARGVYETTIVQ